MVNDDNQFSHWIVAIVNPDKYAEWTKLFDSLGPSNGELSCDVVKAEMVKSNLRKPTLRKYYFLSFSIIFNVITSEQT